MKTSSSMQIIAQLLASAYTYKYQYPITQPFVKLEVNFQHIKQLLARQSTEWQNSKAVR
jgi:hypothetical protein